MLYIATSNKSKFEKLESLIGQISPKIRVRGILDKHIKEPIENGRDEIENATIKAKYYFSILKGSVLVEDNGIYFNGLKLEQQPGWKFKDSITSGMSVSGKVDYWAKFLEKNKIKMGYIRYVFVLAMNGENFKEEVGVPFSVLTTRSKFSFGENILNNFVGPMGSKVPFTKMSRSELSNYRRTNILPTLVKLMRPHISDI